MFVNVKAVDIWEIGSSMDRNDRWNGSLAIRIGKISQA